MSVRLVLMAMLLLWYVTPAQAQVETDAKAWTEQMAALLLKRDTPAVQQAIRKASEKPEHGQAFINAMQTITVGYGEYGDAVLADILKDRRYGTTQRLVVSYLRYREKELFIQWRFARDDKNWWVRGLSFYDSFDKATEILRD